MQEKLIMFVFEVQLFPPCPPLITALLCPCKSNVRVFAHNRKTHIVFVFGESHKVN